MLTPGDLTSVFDGTGGHYDDALSNLGSWTASDDTKFHEIQPGAGAQGYADYLTDQYFGFAWSGTHPPKSSSRSNTTPLRTIPRYRQQRSRTPTIRTDPPGKSRRLVFHQREQHGYQPRIANQHARRRSRSIHQYAESAPRAVRPIRQPGGFRQSPGRRAKRAPPIPAAGHRRLQGPCHK